VWEPFPAPSSPDFVRAFASESFPEAPLDSLLALPEARPDFVSD
jgi:hypothetical protein